MYMCVCVHVCMSENELGYGKLYMCVCVHTCMSKNELGYVHVHMFGKSNDFV